MYICIRNTNTVPMRHPRIVITVIALLALSGPARAQWNYDIPFPKPFRAAPDTVSITFIGDVMMHSNQLKYDYDAFFSELGPITRDADISVANLEFSLAGKPYTGYPSFSAPDGYAYSIADHGVDVFLTANNHILDKGRRGLKRTLQVYDSMRDSLGIRYTGCAADPAADASGPGYLRPDAGREPPVRALGLSALHLLGLSRPAGRTLAGGRQAPPRGPGAEPPLSQEHGQRPGRAHRL